MAYSVTRSNPKSTSIVWFRIGDLRLRDNPALAVATQSGSKVLPVFAWCPQEERLHTCPGQQRSGRDWSYEGTTIQALLCNALRELDKSLHYWYKNRLWIAGETSIERGVAGMLLDIANKFEASEIHFNRRHEPAERYREEQLEQLCRKAGIAFKGHSAFLFREPERCPIFAAVGNGMHIFKAFWDGWHKGGDIRKVVAAPETCSPPDSLHIGKPFGSSAETHWPFGSPVARSRVTGQLVTDDARALEDHWHMTEEAAHEELQRFQEQGGLARYKGSITRDSGPRAKESRLSPYFRLGLLSMVEAWWLSDRSSEQAKKWLRRCAWRDYSYWMLHHWPDLPEVPMRLSYDKMEWNVDSNGDKAEAWRQGKTGYPLVDAAMRELQLSGYMQQNMRHTVGQFFVECLGGDWRDGEEWFHITLADSDLAINSMMWQHQGATGVSQWLVTIDCHPVRHAGEADPTGSYVRKWVPELAHLPQKYLHSPWLAPRDILGDAAKAYPQRILENTDAARAAFVDKVCRARSLAPLSTFSKDGCDLISLPQSSSLSGTGIRALTEKCFKSSAAVPGSVIGDSRGPQGKGKGKGKRKQQDWSANGGYSQANITQHSQHGRGQEPSRQVHEEASSRQVYEENPPVRRSRWSRPRSDA